MIHFSSNQTAQILKFQRAETLCPLASTSSLADLLDRCDGKISRLLLLLRETYALSQEELGALIGLSKSCVSRIEAGKYKKPEKLLSKLKRLHGKGAFNRQKKKEKERMTTTSHLSVVKKENRKKLPLYKIYANKTYAETGVTPEMTVAMIKRIKLSYKAFRDSAYHECLSRFAWDNILEGKKYAVCYLALANFLLEWNYKYGYKLVERIADLPNIYFKEVLFPYYDRIGIAPTPFQILSEVPADKWHEYWRRRTKDNPHIYVEAQTFHSAPKTSETKEETIVVVHDDLVAGIDYECEAEDDLVQRLPIRTRTAEAKEKEKEFETYCQNLREEGGDDKVQEEILKKITSMCGGEAEYKERKNFLDSYYGKAPIEENEKCSNKD